MNKKKFIILISSVAVIIIIIAVFTQSYPIALVNWQPITLKSFQKYYSAALNYSEKALETYDKSQSPVLNSSEVQMEIKRAALDQLIGNAVIHQELKKQIKSNELEKMVNNKIEEALKGKDIKDEVKTLFGLSPDEFKKIVLRPQVEKEIMAARLLLQSNPPTGGFDGWLKETRKQAKVIILLPNLKWDGEGVVLK